MASLSTLCSNKGPFSIQMRQNRAQEHKGNRTTKHTQNNKMWLITFSLNESLVLEIGIWSAMSHS